MKTQNKGVALLWALVVSMVLLIVAGSMAGLIVKELRMAINIDMSEAAYAAARSGIDVGKTKGCTAGTYNGTLNSALGISYTVVVSNVVGTNCTIESTGHSISGGHEIARKLKTELTTTAAPTFLTFPADAGTLTRVGSTLATYFVDPGTEADPKGAGAKVKEGNINGSFYQQFDLSKPSGAGVATIAMAGTLNSSASTGFGAGIGKDRKFYTIRGNVTSPTITAFGSTLTVAEYDALSQIRFKIEYDDTSFVVTAINPFSGKCLAKTSVPLAGYRFNKLATFASGTTMIATKESAGINVRDSGAYLKNMGLRNMAATPAAPAATCTLYSSLSQANVGQTITLSHTTANATAGTINNGVGVVTLGSTKSVTLASVPITYTMTVTGAGLSGTCSTTINPVPPPTTYSTWYDVDLDSGIIQLANRSAVVRLQIVSSAGGQMRVVAKEGFPGSTTVSSMEMNEFEFPYDTREYVKEGYNREYYLFTYKPLFHVYKLDNSLIGNISLTIQCKGSSEKYFINTCETVSENIDPILR